MVNEEVYALYQIQPWSWPDRACPCLHLQGNRLPQLQVCIKVHQPMAGQNGVQPMAEQIAIGETLYCSINQTFGNSWPVAE
jgi:hypothetical protein